jgi:hypothetical protein
VADVLFSEGVMGGVEALVSLGSAFIDMAVQALSYYLLVFLVPVLMTIMLAVRQRRERLEVVSDG